MRSHRRRITQLVAVPATNCLLPFPCLLRLWPSGMWRGRVHRHHPAALCPIGRAFDPAPFPRYDEQRCAIWPSEHASEAAQIRFDCLEYLAAFADAHAALIRYIGVPDGILGIDANAVGDAISQVCPCPSV